MNRISMISSMFFLSLLALSCSLLVFGQDSGNQTSTPHLDCSPLPETFAETDLIGTWVSEYFGGLATDTLILRGDGTYKQAFKSPGSGLNFESDWQDWWIEHRQSGFLRLHLEGMRRCDDIESLCEKQGGGLEQNMWAIDECENEIVKMSGEVTLIVTGVPDNYRDVPRGIWLQHARLAGAEYYYTFQLQKEP